MSKMQHTVLPRIAAVIFDMDGVLLDTEPISLRAWRAAAAELGLELDEALANRFVGRSRTSIRDLLHTGFGAAFPFDDLFRRVDVRYGEALAAGGIPRKPGVIELLDFLDARRLPRAVVTSTAAGLADHKLAQAGLRHRIEVLVGGDQVAAGKPSPDGYLLAASRLARSPGECLVFEDSGPGLQAASAAGMVPVFVPDVCIVDPEVRALAFAEVPSLVDGRELIMGSGLAFAEQDLTPRESET